MKEVTGKKQRNEGKQGKRKGERNRETEEGTQVREAREKGVIRHFKNEK